ncbi:transcriptional repressor [Streptococcus pneumoniae]|nr:transcriptional repressor [Streptococcus pneumoniae]
MAKNLKLKLARVERDLTQGQLAEAVGVTRQTIGLIEAGKYNPSLSLCQSLALPVYLQMFRENPRPTILGGRR